MDTHTPSNANTQSKQSYSFHRRTSVSCWLYLYRAWICWFLSSWTEYRMWDPLLPFLLNPYPILVHSNQKVPLKWFIHLFERRSIRESLASSSLSQCPWELGLGQGCSQGLGTEFRSPTRVERAHLTGTVTTVSPHTCQGAAGVSRQGDGLDPRTQCGM